MGYLDEIAGPRVRKMEVALSLEHSVITLPCPPNITILACRPFMKQPHHMNQASPCKSTKHSRSKTHAESKHQLETTPRISGMRHTIGLYQASSLNLLIRRHRQDFGYQNLQPDHTRKQKAMEVVEMPHWKPIHKSHAKPIEGPIINVRPKTKRRPTTHESFTTEAYDEVTTDQTTHDTQI